MKDSKQYAQKLTNLHKALKRKYGSIKAETCDDPAESIVRGIIAEHLPFRQAQAATNKCLRHFVDLNDLRVSRMEEILWVLGGDTPQSRQAASEIYAALAAIYEKYNTPNLTSLRKATKSAAREVLQKLDCLSPFVLNYCMATAMQAHAVPVTDKMLSLLEANDMIAAGSGREATEAFIGRITGSQKTLEFSFLLLRAGQTGKIPVSSAGNSESTRKSVKKKKK